MFYLVIDHSTGDVYFLNLVDESDLLALLEDEGYEAECDCKVKCEAGAVNTDCPVCRTDLKGCKGEEPDPPPKPPEGHFCHGCARYGLGCVRPCYRDAEKNDKTSC